ncbi:hypothetical protein SAMN05421819_4271 [Bryocella elongata]|uniref:Outer membrane protein beta-barrel domain-containing protein n=1 Tax=Bryocella elongata TaxID=863522 RepID=A0A1H6C712_9BACT|nr:hypothetical protein [Bryocella elongata]SEG68693.1 hypothetical protein SAMN05421819_4271 [Bryocella elongata]
MSKSIAVSEFVRRSVALTALLGASVAVMGAQTSTATSPAVVATPQFSSSVSTDDAATPAADATTTAPNMQLASNALHLNLFGNAMQYGGRQSYGRPRYRGSNTNADGSPKWDFYVGAGAAIPVSTTSTNNTLSWGFQGGGGRMFNRHVGVNLEFGFDNFGLTAYTISDYLYVNTGSTDNSSYDIQGNMHVWNFSVQPIYKIEGSSGLGGFVTGGAGFYHKVTNFTAPTEACSIYYGCYTENEAFDHYSSNAPGFDIGGGLTYKMSRFSNQQLYVDARYVYMANQYRAGATDSNYTTYTGYNYYPANSLHTTYIPVKFGLRF